MEQKRLPIFADRFGVLRGEMTQGEFAEFLGISRPTVGFYENGTRLPDALVLQQIAVKCKVSADWILGISEYPTKDTERLLACDLGISPDAVMSLFALKEFVEETEKVEIMINGISSLLCETEFPIIAAQIGGLRNRIIKAKEYEKEHEYDGLPTFSTEYPSATVLLGFDACKYFLQEIEKDFVELVVNSTGYAELRSFVEEKRALAMNQWELEWDGAGEP